MRYVIWNIRLDCEEEDAVLLPEGVIIFLYYGETEYISNEEQKNLEVRILEIDALKEKIQILEGALEHSKDKRPF